MRILVLMPCDERQTYQASGLMKYLDKEAAKYTFSMPMYMDYLRITKLVKNEFSNYCYTALAAKKLVEASIQHDEPLIICGNVNKNYSFDAILTFMDGEETQPYEDKFLDKIRSQLDFSDADLSKLKDYFLNLYEDKDAIFRMKDWKAAAEFISKYFKSNQKLEEVKAEWNKR